MAVPISTITPNQPKTTAKALPLLTLLMHVMPMAANTWTNIQIRASGRVPGPDDLEPVTRAAAEQGRAISAYDYIRAVQTFHRTGRQLGAFFESHDVLLSPTIARVSLPLGVVRMDGSPEAFQQELAPMVAFTAVCNAAGVPAMSVPLAWTITTGGRRVFYTALGHKKETYSNPLLVRHILGGVLWALGAAR